MEKEKTLNNGIPQPKRFVLIKTGFKNLGLVSDIILDNHHPWSLLPNIFFGKVTYDEKKKRKYIFQLLIGIEFLNVAFRIGVCLLKQKETNANVLEAVKKEEPNWERLLAESSNFDWFNPNEFNWSDDSWMISKYAPQLFDADRFNWEYSWTIVRYCPEHFNPEKYNWERYSGEIIVYAPQLFDSEKFNWIKYSWAIAQYGPELFDANKFVWNESSELAVRIHRPELLKFKPQSDDN